MPMNQEFIEELRSLLRTISLLKRSIDFFIETKSVNTQEADVLIDVLSNNIRVFLGKVKNYSNFFKGAEDFSEYFDKNLNGLSGNGKLQIQHINLFYVRALELEVAIEYFLSDKDSRMADRVDIAFHHLRAIIACDGDVKEKWAAAFKEGEVDCEKLGALHLLHHGVFPFKIDGNGARTDLAFGSSILADDFQGPGPLVLTEWKRVGDEADSVKKRNEAIKQCQIYAKRSLLATELKSIRYIVLVSNGSLSKQILADQVESDHTYRIININVNPQSPSKEARESAG